MADAPDPLEAGMTYVEKLDFREQAHRHEMERVTEQTKQVVARAKADKAESRHGLMVYVGVAIVIGAVILGIVFAIYKGTRPGPYSDQPSGEERRETACIEAGGGWVPQDLLASGEHGMCVFPGRAEVK